MFHNKFTPILFISLVNIFSANGQTNRTDLFAGTLKLVDQGVVDPNEIICLAKAGKPVPTPMGLGQVEGDGTKSTDFESDKETLKTHIKTFIELPAEFDYPQHPYFGKIERHRWAELVTYHLNHHLGQFEV